MMLTICLKGQTIFFMFLCFRLTFCDHTLCILNVSNLNLIEIVLSSDPESTGCTLQMNATVPSHIL